MVSSLQLAADYNGVCTVIEHEHACPAQNVNKKIRVHEKPDLEYMTWKLHNQKNIPVLHLVSSAYWQQIILWQLDTDIYDSRNSRDLGMNFTKA